MIAGIDFSTKYVDVILLDEDTGAPEWHRFDVTEDALTGEVSGDAFDRTRRIRSAMPSAGWWQDKGVIAIGIEQPRGNQGVTPLFRAQGAILACLPTSLLVQPWNPAGWKRAVGLSGAAGKPEIKVWGQMHLEAYDVSAWPQDAFDAYGIACATRDAIEIGEAA